MPLALLWTCAIALAVCGMITLLGMRHAKTTMLLVGIVLTAVSVFSYLLTFLYPYWLQHVNGMDIRISYVWDWPTNIYYIGFMVIPVIFILASRDFSDRIVRFWRILAIVFTIGALAGIPMILILFALFSYGLSGLDLSIGNVASAFIGMNMGNTPVLAALLVLAFTPRGTQKADEKIPREDANSVWYGVLGFVIPVAGLIGWLMWRKPTPLRAKSIGIGAMIGTIAYAIVGIVYYLVNHSNTMNALY